MSDATSPVLVGREGVAVDDPFNPHRVELGDFIASCVDLGATKRGPEVRQEDEAALNARLERLGEPFIGTLDRGRAAESVRWGAREGAAEERWLLAAEESRVLEGRRELWGDRLDELEGRRAARRRCRRPVDR